MLRWTAPDDGSITGYRILRRRPTLSEDGLLECVANTQSTAATFTDTDVTAGVQLSEAIAANAQMAAQQAKAAGGQLKGRGRRKLPLPGSGRQRSPDSPDSPALSNPG